jgi:hypothetical protein
MRDTRRPAPEDPAATEDGAVAETPAAIGLAVRDRLLLAFAELAMYGVAAEDDVHTEPEQARAEIAALLRMRAPHGLGSYVFRLRTDEGGGDTRVALYTSGPEVDRAVVAACAHHGLAVRPGPRPGVLLVGA